MLFSVACLTAAVALALALTLGRRRRFSAPLTWRGALAVVAGFALAAGAACAVYWLAPLFAPPAALPGLTPLAAGTRPPPPAGPCLNGPSPTRLPPEGSAVVVLDVWADW